MIKNEKPVSSQLEKFITFARDLECDDDPKHFRERVGKLAVQKPKKSVGESK
jgi:hypothetical protein